jgi:hypothetical protein
MLGQILIMIRLMIKNGSQKPQSKLDGNHHWLKLKNGASMKLICFQLIIQRVLTLLNGIKMITLGLMLKKMFQTTRLGMHRPLKRQVTNSHG